MTPARKVSATLLLVAALLAPPAHASDCYRIQDPDQRSDCLARTR